MSYQVFARKYRPRTFDDILGQDHVVRTLKNAITQDRLAHAFLFVGPRGTGKTSTARILAKALNSPGGPRVDFNPDDDICVEIAEGRSLDVLEIDGASNNSVEDIRNLRENVQFAPARGKFRIYYIDEVHMLSTSAFNALLKTLEEPPPHVKFIFATTEPHKILATILSRCQRFDLRPIPADIIAGHLLQIAKNEGVNLQETAAWAIAKGADGGMRDAQSMLDQLVAFCGNSISEANVLDIFGFTSRETVAALTTALLERETPAALKLIQRESDAGRELGQLLGELIGCLRNLLVAGVDSGTSGDGIPAAAWEKLTGLAKGLTPDRLLAAIDCFAETEGRLRWSTNKRLHLELGLVKAIQALNEVRINDLIKVLGNVAEQFPESTPDPAPASLSPDPAPVPKPAPPAKTGSIDQQLDALIEAAPETAPEAEPAPIVEPPPEQGAEKTAPETPQEDEFYKDPLIQKALEIFKAKIV